MADSKQLIYVLGSMPPPYGGVSVFNSLLLDYLKGQDLNVHSVSDKKRLIFTKRKSVCLDSTSFFIEYPSLPLVVLFSILKILKKFRWIKFIHDSTLPDRFKKFNLLKRFSFKLALFFIDEIVTVNVELKNWLSAQTNKKQITVIGSLLPIPDNYIKSTIPEELKIIFKKYEKIICSIGVFTENYGFKQLADTIEKLRSETGIDVGLILCDGTFATNEKYKESVLKGREWINVFKNIPHPLILAILKKCNLFVRNVKYESYGLSRIESILVDTRVLATNVGEIRGMIVYDFNNVDELFLNIKNLISNSENFDLGNWKDYFKDKANKNADSILRLINAKTNNNIESDN